MGDVDGLLLGLAVGPEVGFVLGAVVGRAVGDTLGLAATDRVFFLGSLAWDVTCSRLINIVRVDFYENECHIEL